MPNQEERPRYTDPDHPYSGSGARYQNRYDRNEYHRGDGPFQFPWWAIVIGFVVWWPLGFVFIGLNSAMRRGQLGGFEQKARRYTRRDMSLDVNPVYAQNQTEGDAGAARNLPAAPRKKESPALATGLTIAGIALLAVGLLALPDGIYWLPDALMEGGYYWTWLLEESIPVLMMLTGGVGCLFGAHTIRTGRRMRKKIDNIVGDAKNMPIADIAGAIPCSYDKCCKYLENCIDDGVFGPDAYLDMRRRYLVVEGKAPEPAPKKRRKPKIEQKEKDQYQKILDDLRAVNDAIPDEEMSDKIDRLEAVSAKIFEQAKSDPTNCRACASSWITICPPRSSCSRPTRNWTRRAWKGRISANPKSVSNRRWIPWSNAFETQLDQLFQDDALDVSADIDVMENMLRADGLTGETPFKL